MLASNFFFPMLPRKALLFILIALKFILLREVS
jgi:hypothetical protein